MCTALIYAAEEGHLSVVWTLLDFGADTNIQDHIYKHTALVWAAKKNHIVSELLARRVPHDTWYYQIITASPIRKNKNLALKSWSTGLNEET